MRYLNSYKLFESSDDAIRVYSTEIDLSESIKDYLKDIFLELEDDGFEVDIEGRWMRTSEFEELTGFEVKIIRSKPFLLEEVNEHILTCESYLKENGFQIDNIQIYIPDINGRGETYSLDYLIKLNKSNPEVYKLDRELVQLILYIQKTNPNWNYKKR